MRNGKRTVVLIFMISTILLLTASGFAKGFTGTIKVSFNSVNIKVNGNQVSEPNILYSDTTFVPIRSIANMLDKEVEWDSPTNTVNITDKRYQSSFSNKSEKGNSSGKLDPKYENIMNLLSSNIKFKIESINRISAEIVLSDRIRKTLAGYENLDDLEKFEAVRDISGLLTERFLYSGKDISGVKIFLSDGRLITSVFSDSNEKLSGESLQYIKEKAQMPEWSILKYQNKNVLAFVSAIPSIDTGENLGFLTIELNNEFINEIFSSVKLSQNSKIFILNHEGVVVSSDNTELEIGSQYNNKILSGLYRETIKTNKSFVLSVDNKEHQIIFSRIDSPGWFVIASIPLDEVDFH